jgi:hypothetical protein
MLSTSVKFQQNPVHIHTDVDFIFGSVPLGLAQILIRLQYNILRLDFGKAISVTESSSKFVAVED